MRFARNLQFQIKTGKETEFNTLFEKEVLPVLRKQEGFREIVTLFKPKGSHLISLWDTRKNAETYDKTAYPGLLDKISSLIVGAPTLETYETAATYARA
jgi:heme-degrading monooxygenase HmoA